MPFVRGFLRAVKRRPGHPDIGLPEPEEEVDPDYGIEEGAGIGGGPVVPEPPPGIWPPLTPEHPWRPIPGVPDRPSTGPVPPGRPVDPGFGVDEGGHPVQPLPPGTIWPPLPPGVTGKYLALVLIAGMPGGARYRYVVVDASLRPEHPMVPVEPPTAQPKR